MAYDRIPDGLRNNQAEAGASGRYFGWVMFKRLVAVMHHDSTRSCPLALLEAPAKLCR